MLFNFVVDTKKGGILNKKYYQGRVLAVETSKYFTPSVPGCWCVLEAASVVTGVLPVFFNYWSMLGWQSVRFGIPQYVYHACVCPRNTTTPRVVAFGSDDTFLWLGFGARKRTFLSRYFLVKNQHWRKFWLKKVAVCHTKSCLQLHLGMLSLQSLCSSYVVGFIDYHSRCIKIDKWPLQMVLRLCFADVRDELMFVVVNVYRLMGQILMSAQEW